MRHLGFLCGAVVLGACFDPNAVGDEGTGATTIATDDPTTMMPASSNASGSTAMTESTSDDGTSGSDGSLDDSSSTGTSSSTSDDTAGTETNTCVVDGMLGEAEQCDDGNGAAGDGCSDCIVEDGFGCTGEPSLCGPACDPFLQDCARGSGCYPHDPVFACAPAGSGAQQDPCDTIDGCLPGLVCITADVVPGCASPGGNCCSTICITLDPVCPDGLGCVSYYPLGTAPEGLEDVGVCAG